MGVGASVEELDGCVVGSRQKIFLAHPVGERVGEAEDMGGFIGVADGDETVGIRVGKRVGFGVVFATEGN